ncbi:MAG: phospholipid carrier-dependent glycosyltransferase, partial [Proteobacteria bacterium]|nr:phospholipid carrier-dependent glycosyltransferase [Pseudomonadota bacterium]
MPQISNKMKTAFCCVLVLIISYFTYFHNYYKPAKAFYSEYYYIIDAERYVHRMVSFGVNPPLAKMFMALGEVIFNPNKNIDMKGYLNKISVFSETIGGFSFVGVRFFPSLFGFLNGLLIFLIFYRLSKNRLLSLMFSSLYLFENSSIVHFRSAMLDSTLVFFSFLTILYFIYLYEKKKERTFINYFVFGCLTGLAISTKMVGFILTLLFVALYIKEYAPDTLINRIKKLFKLFIVYLSGLCVVFFTVYYIHVALGSNIILKPLYINKNTQVMEHDVNGKSKLGASKEYIEMIKNKDVYNPLKLYIPMRDYFHYMAVAQ